MAPDEASPPHPSVEHVAINVPGFAVTWPKIGALAAAIILSVGGGFWGLSRVIYDDLKEKVAHNEAKNDSLDGLTGTLREAVAKQGAQFTDLEKNVASLTALVDKSTTNIAQQIDRVNGNVTEIRDKVIRIDARLSESIARPSRETFPASPSMPRKPGIDMPAISPRN